MLTLQYLAVVVIGEGSIVAAGAVVTKSYKNIKLLLKKLMSGVLISWVFVFKVNWQEWRDVLAHTLVDSYIVSSFFNVFMPTRIGGDIIRVGDLKGAFNSLTKSASSVVVERFLGISILFLFAFIASLIRLPLVQEIPTIWIGLGLGVLGVTLFLSVIYFDLIGRSHVFITEVKFLRETRS